MAAPILVDHWKAAIEGLDVPPEVFYGTLEAALDSYGVAEVRRGRVMKKEGGFFSPEREYVRVLYGQYLFDICCARFGGGSFVSWWCYQVSAAGDYWTGIPFLDQLIANCVQSPTHYRADTAELFRDWVKKVVDDTIGALTATGGVRLFADAEQKPAMRDFFGEV